MQRQPIVAVLGHVDHGKTSLLDAIRKTNVAGREAGGITQGIGATVITFTSEAAQNKSICFIDTPGHALFSGMRSRGSNLADIALLIVASDDGVAPQTKEALALIRERNSSFIVVLTKVDLPTSNVESTLQQLEKEGVYFEKRGGDIPYIEVSSKTGSGIAELLDLIALMAEVNEISADPEGELEAVVIETVKDKRGTLVSAIVKNGRLKVGDKIYVGKKETKVRGLFDDNSKPVKEINSGFPGQILGFDDLPQVGAKITSKPYELKTEESQISEGGKIKIYVKTKTSGALEALLKNLPHEAHIIGSGVGDLTETDVFLAKAASAIIFLFEAKDGGSTRKLAETEGVEVFKFDVIYSLIEKINEIIEEGIEKTSGKAQILASFPFDGKRVAGCKIMEGIVKKGDKVKIMRDKLEIGRGRITSIRRVKEEISEAKAGEECGVLIAPQLDFDKGDMILSVTK